MPFLSFSEFCEQHLWWTSNSGRKITKLYCVPNFILLYVEAGRNIYKISIFYLDKFGSCEQFEFCITCECDFAHENLTKLEYKLNFFLPLQGTGICASLLKQATIDRHVSWSLELSTMKWWIINHVLYWPYICERGYTKMRQPARLLPLHFHACGMVGRLRCWTSLRTCNYQWNDTHPCIFEKKRGYTKMTNNNCQS